MGDKNLWMTEDRSRFFIIEDDVELDRGALKLRSLRGNDTATATEASAAPHEVDRDAALAFVRETTGDAMGQVNAMLRGLGKFANERFGTDTSNLPNLDLEALLGVPLEQAALDPEGTKARVRERLQRSRTGDSDPGIEQLRAFTESLKQAFSGPQMAEALDKMGSQLKEAAERLNEAAKADRTEQQTPQQDQSQVDDEE